MSITMLPGRSTLAAAAASESRLRRLAVLVAGLPDGPVISISRPNSLFTAALKGIAGSARDARLHVTPDVVARGGAGGLPFPFAVFARGPLQPQLIGAKCGRLVSPDSGPAFIEVTTLDRLYGNLRGCAVLHVGSRDAVGILKSGCELIRRCQPVVVVEIGPEWGGCAADLQAVGALFEDFGYVLDPGLGGPLPDNGLCPEAPKVLVAHPAALRNSPAGLEGGLAPDAADLPVGRRAARWRRHAAPLGDAIGRWSDRLSIAEIAITGAGPIETLNGVPCRWTGPTREARIGFWAPLPGCYRLVLEIADVSYPAELGLGTLRFGATESGRARWSEHGSHRLETEVWLGAEDVRDGAVIALVTPTVASRHERGYRKIGVALSGLELARLDGPGPVAEGGSGPEAALRPP